MTENLLLSTPHLGLPDGIEVTRADSPERPHWIVHDRQTGLRIMVDLDSADFLIEYAQKPPVPWWHWLSPFGALVEQLDRDRQNQMRRGKKFVDYDALREASVTQGAEAVERLLEHRVS